MTPQPRTQYDGFLTRQTVESLEETFKRYGHRPSGDMWTAIEDLAHHLELMADGKLDNKLYLSSLDPGVGKSETIIHFIDALLSSPPHDNTGAIVCVATLDEVSRLANQAAVPMSKLCVITNDQSGLNELGVGRHNANQAQILVTTQQMVQHHMGQRLFAAAEDFFFRGRPRQVRIWDEAYLPGQTISVMREDIHSVLKPLQRSALRSLGAALDELQVALLDTQDGDVLTMPDLANAPR